MTDELHQFILAQFQAMRADNGAIRSDVATLTASIVGLRRDVELVREELNRQSGRIESLAHAVGSVRHDMKAMAIAFDGESIRARLDRIEKHLGLDESQH